MTRKKLPSEGKKKAASRRQEKSRRPKARKKPPAEGDYPFRDAAIMGGPSISRFLRNRDARDDKCTGATKGGPK
jgi:hypothetical protein